MKNIGQTISVTATAATARPGDPHGLYTFMNGGPNTVWYRDASHGVTLTGDAAAMRVLLAAELKAGEPITLKGIDWNVACATGETATLRILPGSMGSSINATISGVVVNQDLETIKGIAVTVNGGNRSTGVQTTTLADNDPLVTAIGPTDASVATAGGVGSVNAKLRKISTDLGTIDADTGAMYLGIGDTDDSAAAAGGEGSVNAKLRKISTDIGTIDADTGSIKTAIEYLTTTQIEKTPTWTHVVVTNAGTAYPFAAEGTFATWVGVEAVKRAGANTLNVYIGGADVDKDNNKRHPVGAGATWEYRARPGAKFDLNDFYVDADTSLNEIQIVYEPA